MSEGVRKEKILKDYVMSVLGQQLDELLADATASKTKPNTSSPVYDCESYNDKQLFEYLFQIWM